MRGLFVILAFVSAAGCNPAYVPPSWQTPLFKKAGEVHLAAQGSLGSDAATSVGAQAGWAFTDNLMVLGTGSFASKDEERNIKHRHAYGELALGYYLPLDISSANLSVCSFSVEVIGGAGLGSTAGDFDFPFSSSDPVNGFVSAPLRSAATAEYHRYFVQLNLALSTIGKLQSLTPAATLETGIGLRVAFLRYFNLRRDSDGLLGSASAVFPEPVYFVRFGSPVFRIDFQLGFVWTKANSAPFDFDPLQFSIGASVMLGR